MIKYEVTGMSCAACQTRVEKAVSQIEGVTSVSVNLLTNSMGVEGTAAPEKIIQAVEKAGYGAQVAHSKSETTSSNKDDRHLETQKLIQRLVSSIILCLILMYISMGHMMWNWPLFEPLAHDPIGLTVTQLLLASAVMMINQRFFISGFTALWHKAPNMDTLVALGSMASYIYSTYALYMMIFAQSSGDMETLHLYMHDLYFESAAMILTLITVGKMLESRSKGKTTDALKSLMKLAPQSAVLLIDGIETTVSIEQVKKGDIFVVRPGESIPVDGVVIKGSGSVNEAALTGESVPVEKKEQDKVSAATINQEGFLTCEATRIGEDTTLSQIIAMVSDAAATKAPIAKVVDKVSGVFVPVVIMIAIITTAIWLLLGETFAFALARGISVLVISCPCALGLATPVAIMVGNGVGAKHGILFKTATALEETGKVNIAVLDKTGTITLGEPKVTDIITQENVSEEKLLQLAASLESKSEHPLAKAILAYAQENNVAIEEVEDFTAVSGNGLSAKWNQKELSAGKAEFIKTKASLSGEWILKAESFAKQGKTPLYFVYDGELLGCIAVADVIKEDSPQAIDELKNMGLKVVMLTGDHELTAKAIGEQAHVDEIIANVLPSGKEEVIRKLSKQGKVVMIGDGINDAPALTRAHIGMAIGAGSDVAIDAADVVLMKNSLKDAAKAIRLSRKVLSNIHQNLFWAFFYNAIGIPLAAGVFIKVLGWQLNPMFGAAAMGLSSFCVVSNALRLNLVDITSSKHDHKKHKKVKQTQEEQDMEKIMMIEGMMCGHCEASVKKALEAIDGVVSATPDHTKNQAVVVLAKPVDNAVLKQAVEAKDYTVTDIK